MCHYLKQKKNFTKDYKENNLCGRGGIGIRDRLKICCPLGHVGSSPTDRICQSRHNYT